MATLKCIAGGLLLVAIFICALAVAQGVAQ